MYNIKDMEIFISKVHKEADVAAQKVYDKYTPELIRRIQKQLFEKDELFIAMGTAGIKREGSDNFFGDNLSELASRTQYCEELSANFVLPQYIYKNSTKQS